MDYYGANNAFNASLMNRIKEKFRENDVVMLENMIKIIVDEISYKKGQTNGN